MMFWFVADPDPFDDDVVKQRRLRAKTWNRFCIFFVLGVSQVGMLGNFASQISHSFTQLFINILPRLAAVLAALLLLGDHVDAQSSSGKTCLIPMYRL